MLTAYGLNGHHFTAFKFIEKVEKEPCFQAAICRLVPLMEERMPAMLELLSALPESTLSQEGSVLEVCSKARAELYKRQLMIRLEKIFVPVYEKILDLKKEEEKHPQPLTISLD